MQRLEMGAKVILTDSGGIQKEAFFHAVPCITLRDETEWIETVKSGWNTVVSADKHSIIDAFDKTKKPLKTDEQPYGNGDAANIILETLL